eukprot:GHUV01031885.1.p1 GENE.GHUV01031885.1~~GHUV01031885.1.p1  ORF type:complete len:107 (+),score=10.46 GHUV01031885.1:15-335(+)
MHPLILCVLQFYKLTNSHTQISSYVFDVVRASVPKMILDDVFLEKEAIAMSIKQVTSGGVHGNWHSIRRQICCSPAKGCTDAHLVSCSQTAHLPPPCTQPHVHDVC